MKDNVDNRDHHKYLHLEHESRHVNLRRVAATVFFMAFSACVGYLLGAKDSYELGRTAGVNEVESAILMSIREGMDFSIDKNKKAKLVVRVRDSSGFMRGRNNAKLRADAAEKADNQIYVRYRTLSIYDDEKEM